MDEPLDSPYPVVVSSIFPRSLYVGSGLCTTGLAILAPDSLTATLIAQAGLAGAIASGVFGLALLALFLDIVVNDLMPNRFYLRRSRDYRWLAVSSLACVFWLFGTLAVLPQNHVDLSGSWVLVLWYFAQGAWGMWFAWSTKLKRYRTTLARQTDHGRLA